MPYETILPPLKSETDYLEWGDLYRNRFGVPTKYFPIHEGQNRILESKARFTAAMSGTGSGKTSCGALWLYREIQKNPTGSFLIVAPTFNILYSATLPAWSRAVENTDLQGIEKVSRYAYELPTGGKIYLRSADNPDSFEGIQANAAWIDEGGQITRPAWDSILRRLGAKKGRCLITTTPYSHNWLYTDFFEKWSGGDPNYCCVQFSSIANPSYSLEEFNRAKASLPPHKFAMFYLGQWQRASGLVYPDIHSCLVDASEVPSEGYRLFGGSDWGFNDPWATIVGLLDNDDCLWLVEEVYQRGLTTDEYLAKGFFRSGVQYFADPSRSDTWKTLRRKGVSIRNVKRGATSIESGIERVNSRIKTGRLKIVKGAVKALLGEVEEYRYPSKNEETIGDKPIALGADHCCDALRYLIMGIDRKARH